MGVRLTRFDKVVFVPEGFALRIVLVNGCIYSLCFPLRMFLHIL